MMPWLECGGGIQLPFPETNIKGYITLHAWPNGNNNMCVLGNGS